MAQISNVIDMFSHKLKQQQATITRIAPELDGLEMLYSNDSSEGRVFSLKVLCWALYSDGKVEGMVPWLDQLVPCTSLKDPLNGHWEGYFIPLSGDVFFEPPPHKIAELDASVKYYKNEWQSPDDIVQEIPDTLGTHGVFIHPSTHEFHIAEIATWRLYHDGTVLGMLIDDEYVHSTPVLPGDDCLYAAQSHKDFRYFFQYRIANKIKDQDPDALAAMSLLIKP